MKNPQPIHGSVDPIEGAPDSLFITCASYEERTTVGARRLSPEYRVQQSIIFRAAEYKDKGKAPKYFEDICERLRDCSDDTPGEVTFGIEKPIDFIREFERRLNTCKKAKSSLRNVTVDITTFPRQELLILLKHLDHHPNRGNIRLLYAEPERYASEEENKEDRWLTRGVRSVHSIPGFSGIQYPQLAKLLVVILGHEGERTHITLRRHQPDKVIFLGQGDAQYHAGLKEIAQRENQDMIAQFSEQCFWNSSLPARGVLETKMAIERIFQNHRHTHSLFVAPNGTKLQLIGTYLAARKILELQVTYATPALYNWQKYSTGTGPLWEISLEPMDVAHRKE